MKNYINKITQSKWTGIALAAVGILMMAFGIYRATTAADKMARVLEAEAAATQKPEI